MSAGRYTDVAQARGVATLSQKPTVRYFAKNAEFSLAGLGAVADRPDTSVQRRDQTRFRHDAPTPATD